MGYANVTTFSNHLKGANNTLSNGNLTSTVTSASDYGVGATCKITGPTYFEMLLGATLSGRSYIGLSSEQYDFSLEYVGQFANQIGYNKGGEVRINASVVSTIMSYTANDNIGVAIDLANKLIWFRKNGGNWNNDVIGNQNPVGAVGGISFASVEAGLVPAWSGSNTASATAKFASADWTYSAPTDFLSIDTLQTTKFDNKAVANLAATFPQYGNILTSTPSTPKQHTQYPDGDGAWFGSYKTFSPAGTFTTISGVVKEGGTPVSGKTVYLYNSANGEFLGSAVSDGSGVFSIPALAKTNVFAVALDPTFQAIVYDQLVPV